MGLAMDTYEYAKSVACTSTLHLLQALQSMLSNDWTTSPKLYLVTKGAQVPVTSPAQAMLWGLGATIPHEMPELSCTMIDIGEQSTSDDLFLRSLTRTKKQEFCCGAVRKGQTPRSGTYEISE